MSFAQEDDKRIQLLNVAGKYVALGSVMGHKSMTEVVNDALLQFGGKRAVHGQWKPIQNAFIQYLSDESDWLSEVKGPDGYCSLQIDESRLPEVSEIERVLSNFFDTQFGDSLVKQVVLEEFDVVMERAV